jgi:hypothetical protein
MSVQIVKLLDPIQLSFGNLNFTGVYDNGTAYVTGDSVSYNSSSYVAKLSTTGNLPTDTTYWQLLAEGKTAEDIEDTIGAILVDTATIDFTYTDATPSITADVKDNSITDTKLTTGINSNKISGGSVSNTEFDYLDGVTSSIQTQLNTGTTNLSNHLSDATDAHDASAISNIPSGNLTATDIQGAVDELQGDIDTLNTIKAPLASPALTGTPTAPTASANDNSTQIATTAYVDGAITTAANLLTNEYYVDKSGNDTTGNGSKDRPFLTVQKAATAIGTASSSADYEDVTKRFYSIKIGNGIYTENVTFGTRMVTLIEFNSALIVGNITVSFDKGKAAGATTKQPKFILRDGDLRPSFSGSNIPLSGLNGNLDWSYINGGSSVTCQIHLINTGITGNITTSLGSGGTNNGVLQVYGSEAYVTGQIQITQGSGAIFFDAIGDDTVGFGGATGNCKLQMLRNVRIAGIVNVAASHTGAQWYNTSFTTASSFSGSSGTISADANSWKSYNTNVTTKGSETFTLLDDAQGVALTVATPANWSTTPTQVKQSLDLLAADKANLVSPIFTGIPTAPTASQGNNSTQLATTAYVDTGLSTKANDSSVVHITGIETITGAKTFSETVTIAKNTTIFNPIYATNGDASGDTSLLVRNDSLKIANLGIFGSGATPYGAIAAGDAYIYSDSGSLVIMSDGASSNIKFAADGNTEQMRLSSNGNLLVNTTTDNATDKLQVNGSITVSNNRIKDVSTPTVSTDAANKAFVEDTTLMYSLIFG